MAATDRSEAKHRTKPATDQLLAKRQAALSEALGFTRVTADQAIHAALTITDDPDSITKMVALLRPTQQA